jgi:uncharacterized protein YdhG (YjbR/CyaY superfamily)
MATVAEYLAGIGFDERAAYERIRAIAREIVPDAGETISYGMPTLTYRGKHLIYFGVFTKHMSVYPPTVKFTVAEPVPRAVVEEMVRARVAAIDAG